MAIPDGFVDEIKTRIRPSDLIGRTVSLRRQGREFVGLSPFKNERSPSFFVNDEKGFYHCFSSQKHGDVFTWLQETQGLSFMEAVEALAREAGLEMPKPDPESARREQMRKGLIEWVELAQRFFARRLAGSEGAGARDYLNRRGLGAREIERFGLGYAPDDRRALRDFLMGEGAKIEELDEAGLVIRPEGGGEAYDRFRGRIIFPIHDPRGRLVAFGGRAMSKEARAKYLNSPETPLFHKGATLYRYPEARKAAHDPAVKAKGLIVAEGYMDVIAFARAGIDHAVAPLGTALTEDQLHLLWRAGSEPVICLDGDAAGRRAAALAAERALPLLEPGKTLRFVFLPDGQDPDDLLRDKGRAALHDAIGAARPLADVIWERERDSEPLDDPDRRAGFRKRLRALTGKIADADVKGEYRAEFDRRLAEQFGRPQKMTGGWRRRNDDPLAGPPTISTKRTLSAPHAPPAARHLLLAVMDWPSIARSEAELLSELPCGPLDSLRDAVLDACSFGDATDDGALRASLVRRGFADTIRRLERERKPMRAAMGGEEAGPQTRAEAWRRLAASYMDRVGIKVRDAEERALTEQVLGADDSEKMRAVLAGIRRDRKRKI